MENKPSASEESTELPSGGSLQRKQQLEGEQSLSESPESSSKHSPVHWGRPFADGAPKSSPEELVHCDYEKTSQTKQDLVQSEKISIDAEKYKELHEAIEGGNLELVRDLLPDDSEEKYFLYEGKSALFNAFSYKEYNIASHLIHIGAKFNDSEIYDLYELEIDLDHLNCLLTEYNRRPETSSIFRLISCSQSPQGLEGERLHAVISLYKDLFKSEVMKWLMKVIEITTLDIVYDFESEKVNRIRRVYKEEAEIYGLTVTSSREIFVGAKALLSDDNLRRAKVYGVVAEELCHMALTLLYDNDAKPYREDDLVLKKDFRDIVSGVKSLVTRSCHIESVIMDVYRNYPTEERECELIARIPHLIGIYGEESAKKKLMEYPELHKLWIFYQHNVIRKSKMYTDPSLNTKAHRMMEELRENDLLSYQEKTVKPLKQEFPSLREFFVEEDGISVVTTNCVKLCTLQMYHELKMQYKDLFDKKCLIFSGRCLDRKWNEIMEALRFKVWDYFIIVLDEKRLTLQQLKAKYLHHFDSFTAAGLKIVIITSSQDLGNKFERKTLIYEWNDLSSEYQMFRTRLIEYIFKGERYITSIEKEEVPNVFQSESDILRIMSGEPFVLEDGVVQESREFVQNTYLEREFKVMTANKEVLNILAKSDRRIFIYDVCNLKDLEIGENLLLNVKCSDDVFQEGKKVFIIENKNNIAFDEFKINQQETSAISLHYIDNTMFLRNPESLGDELKKYIKEKRIKEEDMIDLLRKKKTLIISDNAGCGKSTVTSSLLRQVKKNIHYSFVFRIDLWKLELRDDFEESSEKEMFEEIFKMIGIKSDFEKWYFKKCGNQGAYFIFFDGFDEISLTYKSKLLTLMSYLRRKTYVRMVVTTRRNEEQKLVEQLNTYPHQLVPFNEEEQVNCLGKLLKWKMKYPLEDKISEKNKKEIPRTIDKIVKKLEKELGHKELIESMKKIKLCGSLSLIRSEIDELDLSKLVVNVLENMKLEEKIIGFMGIPLHLFMVGSVFYDGNFDMKIGTDVYSLYCKFIEHKVKIYVEEKEGYVKEGDQKKKIVESVTEEAYQIHILLADESFDDKVEIEMKKEDRELCNALGIVSICGKEKLFLHKTFSEFFKAESIRRNFRKVIFIKMLLEDKYEVVRLFLSASLERNNFENLKKGVFEDLNFIFEKIGQISNSKGYFALFEINSDKICRFKIVKKLVKEIDVNVDPGLFKSFILELSKFVKENGIETATRIGCLLSSEIMRYLMKGNCEKLQYLISGFVRFSESPDEVIDVLKEYIFKEHVMNFEKFGFRRIPFWLKRISRGNEEERVLKCILDLLGIETLGYNFVIGLIYYALSNERTEVFPTLLAYFRNVLGNEKFFAKIIESTEYKVQIDLALSEMNLHRNCKVIKEVHLMFGNETKAMFGIDVEFWLILKAVIEDNNEDGLISEFEKVINLVSECFGNENLKEFLQNRNSKGEYLIHELIQMGTDRNLIKHLDLINNIISFEKMKEILKSKNDNLQNIFHFAAKNINLIEIDFTSLYLSFNEIEQLLIGRDKDGRTCLHIVAIANATKLTVWIDYAMKMISSDESNLEKLILAKDIFGNTFLHSMQFNYYLSVSTNEIFKYLRSKLSDEPYNRLLRMRNENGQTFLQIHRNYKNDEFIENCKVILGIELAEELLKNKEIGNDSV